MLKPLSLVTLVLVAASQLALAVPEHNEPQATPVAGSDPAHAPPHRWVSYVPDSQHDGPAAFHAHDDTHPDIRRRQGSASITTPVIASQPTAAYEEPPSLAPVRSDLADSLSSLDSSLDAQVSSAIQEMTTGSCTGVPDVNGTPVTLCGPTAASGPPGSLSSAQNAAAKGRVVAGGLAVGIVGALVL